MRVFEDSIEKLLWPERRETDAIFGASRAAGTGAIDRTNAPSAIWVPSGYVPDPLRPLLGLGRRLFPMFFPGGELTIGPIPQNFPVSVLANADLTGAELPTLDARHAHREKLVKLLRILKKDLRNGSDIFADRALTDGLVDISKCPDFVVNKGHYFGTALQPDEAPLDDADKRALIEFIKTF
jgi:hypothetical protein